MAVEAFDVLPNGQQVEKLSLSEGNSSCAVPTYGATLQSLKPTPLDTSIVIGADSIAPYLESLGDIAGVSHQILPNCGVAMAPQRWPNAVNQPQFPSPLIEPGQDDKHHIRYKLSDMILDQN